MAIVAVAITTVVFAVVRARASTASVTVAFRFASAVYALPPAAQQALGGPLADEEVAAIRRIARDELERAYAGTRLVITDQRDAFWHVEVLQAIRGRKALPDAGHSIGLGPLGGLGELSFTILAVSAIRLAPSGASRATIVEGIGRGIGRAAVHELAHQIVATAAMDNDTDPDSYEFSSFSRTSQYYGELHWAGAGPIVRAKIGR